MIQLRFPQFVDEGEISLKPKKEVTTAAATLRRFMKFFTSHQLMEVVQH
jgi:hypothetical protein